MTLKLETYRSIVIDVGTVGLIKKSSAEYLEYLKESALLVIFSIVENNK